MWIGAASIHTQEENQDTHDAGKGSITTAAMTYSLCHIDAASFAMPSEGTLIQMIMMKLINLAVGDMDAASGVTSETGKAFIISALDCLGCCRTLRFQHKQMVLLLQNYMKATHAQTQQGDAHLVVAGIKFSIKAAAKDPSYATWLYDVAVNASPAVIDVVSTFICLLSHCGL